ncbi:MAG: 50S ribosomal protein L1 [Pirellulaceae bacterium]|nr:MAG: 50S ribosomal protein L1 [Pirellulaceae bacterium]
MPKHSRRYRQLAALAPPKPVDLATALQTLKQFNNTRFDQSVELHVRLGIDPKQADQTVRGSVVLPHGIGRTQRVVVFAKGDLADAARQAGADVVGQEDLANRIKEGWLEFDVCIAAPDMMGLVGPLGRILGPRGLMPSPRAGTVTPDVGRVVREYKAGKVEFKNDSGGNVHVVVGKLSFSEQQLQENIQTFLEYLNGLRPAAVRGAYIRSVHVAATMSPSVAVAL